MKKFVFALELMSLMMLLPVYIVVELNHPTPGNRKAVDVQQIYGNEKERSRDAAGAGFPTGAFTRLAV